MTAEHAAVSSERAPTAIERDTQGATWPADSADAAARALLELRPEDRVPETELVDIPAAGARETLARVAPLVIDLPGRPAALALRRCGPRRATIVTPTGPRRVPTTWVLDQLWTKAENETPPEIEAVVRETFGGDVARAPGALAHGRRALLTPTLAGRPLTSGRIVRAPATTLRAELLRAGLHLHAIVVLAVFALDFLVWMSLWKGIGARVLGAAHAAEMVLHAASTTTATAAAAAPAAPVTAVVALAGFGGLFALLFLWALLQIAAAALLGRLTVAFGGVLRSYLLRGVLNLDPEHIRTEGIGQLFGRVLDADNLDALGLGGAVLAMTGLFELLLAALALGAGASPGGSLGLLLGATVVLGGAAALYTRLLRAWSATRRRLTHDLVERMVGHRTTLVQDRPVHRALADDAALNGYASRTRWLDALASLLSTALPRGWLLLGLIVAIPTGAGARGPAALAASVAGVFLAYSAFRRLGRAMVPLAGAAESWGQIMPLVRLARPGGRHALAARASTANTNDAVAPSPPAEASGPAAAPVPVPASAPAGSGGLGALPSRLQSSSPLLTARGIVYRYPDRPQPVLDGVDLELGRGDRVLLEGPSGAGKTTLGAILTGLRAADAGRLEIGGVSQSILGAVEWRHRVGAAPQFHDNHVIGANLAFNLLLGRRWPPRAQDFTDAEQVCRKLGLGPLLERMPAGLQQQVGETGWQLSHGERSRLFIARSLLQSLDARVLDESFAALDPETLDAVMAAVLERPEALVVIAHP